VEEKTFWNSFPWNKNRSILSEFDSSAEEKTKKLKNPFRETKIETNCRNSVPNHSAEEKQLGILFCVEQNAAGYKKTGLGDLE
jgi:hypothetical protein